MNSKQVYVVLSLILLVGGLFGADTDIAVDYEKVGAVDK